MVILIRNQLYYSYYTFDLHTNFTFYLVDTVNGDEIRQKEARNMFGYKGSYEHVGYIGSARLNIGSRNTISRRCHK